MHRTGLEKKFVTIDRHFPTNIFREKTSHFRAGIIIKTKIIRVEESAVKIKNFPKTAIGARR